MARVIDPLRSSEARGSVGDTTYVTTRGIMYTKLRKGPATEYSTKQVALRLKAHTATDAWQALTEPQRIAWDTYATLHPETDWTGQDKRLSGYNWFLRCSVQGQRISGIWYLDPPELPPPIPVRNLRWFRYAPIIVITWTPIDPPSSHLHHIEIWRQPSLPYTEAPFLTKAHYYAQTNDYPAAWYDYLPVKARYAYYIRRCDSRTNLYSMWNLLIANVKT
jgi:hypothetical protein